MTRKTYPQAYLTLHVGRCAWPPSFHLGPPSSSCSVYSRIVHHLCDAEEPEGNQEGSMKVQQGHKSFLHISSREGKVDWEASRSFSLGSEAEHCWSCLLHSQSSLFFLQSSALSTQVFILLCADRLTYRLQAASSLPASVYNKPCPFKAALPSLTLPRLHEDF